MSELTNDQLNQRLAELLRWHVEYHNRSCAEDDSGWLLLPPARSMPVSLWNRNSICDTKQSAWKYAPPFATDIAAALWAFREAGRQTDLACEKLWDDGEESNGEQLLYWLLMGDTERLLAEAAYAALLEWKEAHNE